jgi:iron complex outermembrane recepter protein
MRKFTYALRSMSVGALLLFVAQVAAQTGTVKGIVTDVGNHPLPGASIIVEGKRTGTLTGTNGDYTLRLAPGQYVLLASFAGQSVQRATVNISSGSTAEQDFNMQAGADLESVVVVGSRSREARSKTSTAVPVDVIKTKDIKPFAQIDVSQMLTYAAPSFQSARQTIADGTDHIDPAGLRGLGPDQTLVLLNGKRRHNTALVNINGTVGRGSVGTDMNTIPAAAIERIEVLRDGAAAQYGSDAIAGVINIVLKKNYNGFTVSSLAGQNFTNLPYNGGIQMRDGVNQQVDFNGGFAKANGSYFNISGQWLKRFVTNRSGDDNIPLIYLGNAGGFPTNPYNNVSNTDYRRFLMDQDAAMAKQRGYNRHNIINGTSYSQNFAGFINAGTKISTNAEFYVTAGLSHRDGLATGQIRNPNAAAQQPVLANGQLFYKDGFLPQIAPTISDWSLLAGVTIKAGEWDLDISNTIGKNSLQYNIRNSGNASLPAFNNVQTTFDAGKISFLQNTTNVDLTRKYNLAKGSSLNVAFGGEFRREIFRIYEGEVNSYENWGRNASIDSIIPYPGQTVGTKFTPVATASGAQVFPGFKNVDAVNASRNVYALYGDVEFSSGKWLFDAAGRYERYEEKGLSYDNLSGKIAARYEISEHISLRGALSNGFRAPSLQQRYFQNTSTQFVNALPSNSLTANNYNPIVRNAFGINELKPEKSTSYSLGFAGKAGKGLTFTVDGYFISIKDRVVLSTPFNRSNALVDTILRNFGVDATTSALQFWTNAVNTETRGIDIVIMQQFRLGKGAGSISLAGNFTATSVVGAIHTNSKLDSARYNPFAGDPSKGIPGNPAANPANDLAFTLFDRQQRGRIETAQPRSKINLTATYAIKNWNFLARAVRFGESEYLHNIDPASKRLTDNFYFNDVAFGTDQIFSARIITDVVVSYKFPRGIMLTVGANNLLDVYPDRVFIDPRNDLKTVYADPNGPAAVPAAAKTTTGYNAGRDFSNRGRTLFRPDQFGFNGRFLFTRISIEVNQLVKGYSKKEARALPQ